MARDDVRRLESLLAESVFACVPDGVHDLDGIYELVRERYPLLCDDAYLCRDNCRSGHNTPEWQHGVRRRLDDLARRRQVRIWRTGRRKQWGFGPRPAPALMSVAFKVTWVEGEDGPWTSPCNPATRRYNVLRARKPWCSDALCACSRLVDTEKRLPRGSYPCLDYRGPLEHCFAPDAYWRGTRRGHGTPMTRTGVGRFAFLTSRRRGAPESERLILSSFGIDRYGDIPELGRYAVAATMDSPLALTVPLGATEAAPLFWDFRPRTAKPKWGAEIFRYIPDDEASAMRHAVAAACGDISPAIWQDTDAARQEEEYVEGERSTRLVSYYERNPRLRSAAVAVHGTRCQVCGFDFGEQYGRLGAGFIEVHHLRPVAGYKGQVTVDPREDMRVVCPNCHRMIHRRPDQPVTVEELQRIVSVRGLT